MVSSQEEEREEKEAPAPPCPPCRPGSVRARCRPAGRPASLTETVRTLDSAASTAASTPVLKVRPTVTGKVVRHVSTARHTVSTTK